MHPEYTADFIARLWARVDKAGPVPAHCPDLGPCWLRGGPQLRNGYTRMGSGEARVLAHVAALELAAGPLKEGQKSLHICDVRHCVRNDTIGTYVVNGVALPRYGHLFIGTQIDNLADAASKGHTPAGDDHWSRRTPERLPTGDRNGARLHPERMLRGEQIVGSYLAENDVYEIRRLVDAKVLPQREIAAMFNTTQTNVSLIGRRVRWKHLS